LDRLPTLVPAQDSSEPAVPFYLDPMTLDRLAEKPAKYLIAYLIDMAKVEALDTMGGEPEGRRTAGSACLKSDCESEFKRNEIIQS